MPTTLPPVLLRAAVVERQTLTLTAPWLQWFEQSYLRQGGQEAATNTELAGGVAGNSDHIGQVEDDLAQTSSNLAALEAEVTTLQGVVVEQGAALEALETRVTTLEGQVTTLQATVTDQGTRLAALEAWKTAMQDALPAVVSVTTVPALANDPATSILLENDLTANWRPPVNSNDSALATAVNAVRSALAA